MANSEPNFGSLADGHLSRVSSDQSSQVFGGDRQTFVVAQNGEYHQVEPLSHEDFDGMTVEEFYGYDEDDSVANTPIGIEEENTSQLFFYEGPDEVSLVALHDAPGGARSQGKEEVFAEDFENGALDEWDIQTFNNANVTLDGGRMRLRVYKCGTAVASRNLGSLEGTLRISFDWETGADMWYEDPGWRLETAEGDPIEYEVIDGPDVRSPGSPGGSRNGSVTVEADVDTEVHLVFRIDPSSDCSGWSHTHTYFWVDNIQVEKEATSETTTFEFDWLPLDGSWEVKDDPDAFEDSDRLMSDLEPTWEWSDGETAGGAHSGFHRALGLELTPEFGEGIDEWVLVDGGGSSLERIELEKESIAIGTLGAAVSDVEYELDIGNLYGSACIYTAELGQFCVTLGPDGIDGDPGVKIGPRDCTDAPGGKTPPLVSVDIEYKELECDFLGGCEDVTHSRSLWVGAELRGDRRCIWIGEEDAGACTRVGCGELRSVVRDGRPVPQRIEDVARSTYETAAEEIKLPSPTSLEGLLIITGVLFALPIVFAAILFGKKIAIALGIGILSFKAARSELS